MSKQTTRRERRGKCKELYLTGEARHPYRLATALDSALAETASGSPNGSGVCTQCKPVLLRYMDTFKALVHVGSELKRRKNRNPHPKNPDRTHYRDLNRQNEWLRENIFDTAGNYLYCCTCVRMALGISKQRIARQRAVKRQQNAKPIVKMSKSDVEKQDLSTHVVMPPSVEESFNKWWRTLEAASLVDVRYPHERHGNAGKQSHSAKMSVKEIL